MARVFYRYKPIKVIDLGLFMKTILTSIPESRLLSMVIKRSVVKRFKSVFLAAYTLENSFAHK